MEFEAIKTQEELDKIIQKRLAKEQAKHKKEVESIIEENGRKVTEYEAKIAEYEQASKVGEESKSEYERRIADLETKVKGYETDSVKTKIALELGIPYALAGKLSGDNEEDIRKDAEALSKFVSQKKATPLARTEDDGDGDNGYREILNGLKGE